MTKIITIVHILLIYFVLILRFQFLNLVLFCFFLFFFVLFFVHFLFRDVQTVVHTKSEIREIQVRKIFGREANKIFCITSCVWVLQKYFMCIVSTRNCSVASRKYFFHSRFRSFRQHDSWYIKLKNRKRTRKPKKKRKKSKREKVSLVCRFQWSEDRFSLHQLYANYTEKCSGIVLIRSYTFFRKRMKKNTNFI